MWLAARIFQKQAKFEYFNEESSKGIEKEKYRKI